MWLKNQVMPYEMHAGDTEKVIDEIVEYLKKSWKGRAIASQRRFIR